MQEYVLNQKDRNNIQVPFFLPMPGNSTQYEHIHILDFICIWSKIILGLPGTHSMPAGKKKVVYSSF